jgi:chromosome segregation ATPase
MLACRFTVSSIIDVIPTARMLEQAEAAAARFKDELERNKDALQLSEQTSKARATELAVSKESVAELERQLRAASDAAAARDAQVLEDKQASAAAADAARKEQVAAAHTAATELAALTSTLRANEVASGKELTSLNSHLIAATNQIQLGEQQFAQKEAALVATEAQILAERTRFESVTIALNRAEAEAAALAAVAASGALGLAHVTMQIKKVCTSVEASISEMSQLTVEPKATRSVQLAWQKGDALGIELWFVLFLFLSFLLFFYTC